LWVQVFDFVVADYKVGLVVERRAPRPEQGIRNFAPIERTRGARWPPIASLKWSACMSITFCSLITRAQGVLARDAQQTLAQPYARQHVEVRRRCVVESFHDRFVEFQSARGNSVNQLTAGLA
jgi:hypothetical protein